MLGSDPFQFHLIFIFYFKRGSSPLILFRYPRRGSYSSFFHFNSCWLKNLLSSHEQFKQPKAEIDLLSAGLTPPIGEPWWTRLLYENWGLKLISTLLSASNRSPWRKKLFCDNFILTEMFYVWAFPHLVLILYICPIPEMISTSYSSFFHFNSCWL